MHLIDRKTALALLNVADRTMRTLDLEPVETIGRKAFYNAEAVAALARERMRSDLLAELARGPQMLTGDDGEAINVELEKALKLKAERIGQEIRNAESIGELAPLDLMRSALADALQTANGFLENVPALIKRAWPTVPGSVLDLIERECAKVRNSVADGRIDYTDARMAEFRQTPLDDACIQSVRRCLPS